MIFKRFEERGLFHYSYAIGSEKNGQIGIVDPCFDVEVYLDFAEKQQYIISHVLETHIHADYISGAYELTKRARATLISPAADESKKRVSPNFFRLNTIVIKVLQTPGHTSEHVCFLVYDISISQEIPIALFTGDLIFPRSIGFPEVMDKKIWIGLAKKLYTSLQKQIIPLADNIKIYPTHGTGFSSEFEVSEKKSDHQIKVIQEKMYTNIEQEKLYNPYLNENLTEKAFIDLLYNHVVPLPAYYERIKMKNAHYLDQGGEFPNPYEALEFKELIESGGTVIDLRNPKAFSCGHIPNSICIGICPQMSFWAARVIPYSQPILLVINDPTLLGDVVLAFARVGFNQIKGYLKGGLESWKQAQLPISVTEEINPINLLKNEKFNVIDVRTLSEWNCGHIPRAKHIPCMELSSRFSEIPKENLVFVCAGGYRSILAASLAENAGCCRPGHISGGMACWQSVGGSLITY